MMSSKVLVALLFGLVLALGVVAQSAQPTTNPSSDAPVVAQAPAVPPVVVAPITVPVVAPVKAPAPTANGTTTSTTTQPSGPAPIVDAKTLGWIDLGALIVSIIIGLVWCVAGYRLLKPVLFLAGFVLFYFVCFNILIAQAPKLATWISMAISAGAGILGGIMLVLVFKLGVFMMGFIFGAVVATLVVAFTPLNGIILSSVATSVSIWVFLGCIVGLGVIVGIAAVIFTRPIFIFVTAWNGSYIVMAAIDKLTKWNLLAVLTKIFTGKAVDHQIFSWTQYQTYVIFGGLVVLAIAGIVVQAKFTARGHHHDKAVMDRKPAGQDDIPLLEP